MKIRARPCTPLCPYRRDAIDGVAPLAQTWRCPRCQTVQHTGCVSAHGRCTVLGCRARPASDEMPPGSHALRDERPYRRAPEGDELVRIGGLVAIVFAIIVFGASVRSAPGWERTFGFGFSAVHGVLGAWDVAFGGTSTVAMLWRALACFGHAFPFPFPF